MDTNKNKHNFENRRYIIACVLIAIVLIYLVRLFMLQLFTDDYRHSANSNALLRQAIYPARGIIYDRNGKILVYNQPMYDVLVITSEIKDLDTLSLCHTLSMPIEVFRSRLSNVKDRSKNPYYSRYTPQIFLPMITSEESGRLQETLFRHKGFHVRRRDIRRYSTTLGAHILGDIGEISERELERDSIGYYRPGDYVGKSGVERFYEKELRGVKGVQILLRDVKGRIQGKYMDGQHDSLPRPGKALTLSIDSGLQALGERLMQHKIGAIVAIEPKTGEILCMVSSPTFDLSTMSGKDRRQTFNKLFADPFKPLLNRAIGGTYPPGSTFKTAQGLIFLQEEIITPSTTYPCPGGFVLGRLRVGCHPHGAPTALNYSLSTSCNAYYCWGLYNMMRNRKYPNVDSALTVWKDHMVSMGMGYRLGIDLNEEVRGFIPNADFYNDRYKHNWSGATIVHISIGQAEITTTPLQIANLGAIIANGGYFITPHLAHSIDGSQIAEQYRTKRYTTIDAKHYEEIRAGMRSAAVSGTCRWLNTMPELQACGKTGTAQNRGRDHGAFLGFAPFDDPKIAIAVYVENGGFGATLAVPIGGMIMQQYLTGKLSPANEARAVQISNTTLRYDYATR